MSWNGFLTFLVNVKWQSETFNELNLINVIIMQSAVVLNMNMEVFRIYDMNTLYKLGDLKYNGKCLCKCGASLAVGRTCPDLSGRTCPRQTISKYHVTASFKMQEKKLTMFYIEAHTPFVIKK